MNTELENLTNVFCILDHLGPCKLAEGYVDWAIEVDIPRNEVEQNDRNNRDVYCYEGRDLWLEKLQLQGHSSGSEIIMHNSIILRFK